MPKTVQSGVKRVSRRARAAIQRSRSNRSAAQRRVDAGNKRARETLKKLF